MASISYSIDAADVPAVAEAALTFQPYRPEHPILFVVPAFNEVENLPRLFDDLAARPLLHAAGSRVIIVDDGSLDGTVDLVRAYAGPLDVRLIELGTNQGPGAAFRAGFDAALAEAREDSLIVTLEADTTSDLDSLPAMLARAQAGAELVLASVHGGGTMVNVSRLRRFLSAAAGSVVRVMLRLDARTVSSFFRVYRASILRAGVASYGDRLIQERGFACKAELLAKLAALGAEVVEVPVDLDGSLRVGESRMRIMPTLAGYTRLMLRQRRGKESVAA